MTVDSGEINGLRPFILLVMLKTLQDAFLIKAYVTVVISTFFFPFST